MLEINLLDIAVILLTVFLTIRGFMRGLVQEVAGLVGLILAFTLARQLQGAVQVYVSRFFGDSSWTHILTYVLIFMTVIFGVSLIAAGLRKLLAVSFAAWLDRILGGVVGFGKALLFGTLLFYFLFFFIPNAPIVASSVLAPVFESMIGYLQGFMPSGIEGTIL